MFFLNKLRFTTYSCVKSGNNFKTAVNLAIWEVTINNASSRSKLLITPRCTSVKIEHKIRYPITLNY